MTWNWTAIGTILLALATFILAYFNWRIIKQNSELRGTERRGKRLKEIIDWGESIANCSLIRNPEDLLSASNSNFTQGQVWRLIEIKIQFEYRAAATKFPYISNIALDFDPSVLEAVKKVGENLLEQMNRLNEDVARKITEGDIFKRVDECMQNTNKLVKSANNMIDVVTNLMPK